MKTPRDRTIGIVYALYFSMAFASVAPIKAPAGSAGHAAGIGLQLLSTAVYAVLVVLLARLLSAVQGGTAATAAFAGLAGCGLQAYGIVTGSAGVMHLALAIFGAFCILLGGLIIGSNFIPRILGVFVAHRCRHRLADVSGAESRIGAGAVHRSLRRTCGSCIYAVVTDSRCPSLSSLSLPPRGVVICAR